MDAALYAGTPLAPSVIGTPEQIAALDYDAARAFHAATHRRDRALVVVRGPISALSFRAALHRAGLGDVGGALGQGAMGFGPTETFDFADPDFQGPARLLWRKLVRLPQPVAFETLVARADVLRLILDSTLPGGFAGPLRHDGRLTRRFYVDVVVLDSQHVELRFRGEPDTGVTPAALAQALESAVAGLVQGIPPETFARIHRRRGSDLPGARAGDDRVLADLSLGRLMRLHPPVSAQDLRAAQDGVTGADIDALAGHLAGAGRIVRGFLERTE